MTELPPRRAGSQEQYHHGPPRRADASSADDHDDGYHEWDDGEWEDGEWEDGYDDDVWHDERYDAEHHHGDGDGPPPGTWPSPGHQRRPAHRRGTSTSRYRVRHPVLTGLAILAALIVVVALGGFLWARSQIDPGGARGPSVSIAIPPGASTARIGDILASKGVIHNGTLFAYYVRLQGDGPLLPGRYSLPKNSPYSTAIKALEAGPKIVTDTLVVPEGFTVAQIAERVGALPHLGLSAQKFLADATNGSVRSPYEPAGVNNLEGLLFPATYQVRQGETEADVLDEMIVAFDARASQVNLTSAARALGYTPYQVVTVASIVEREAKYTSDRGPVASAIYNRLRIGMHLGADSTQAYYLRLTDPTLVPTAAQDDQPSPYNTRLNPGLPPTPISNPGLSSLQAAADPPTTSYLYWVETNPDGKLGFASDNAGFVNLQQQCRAAGLC